MSKIRYVSLLISALTFGAAAGAEPSAGERYYEALREKIEQSGLEITDNSKSFLEPAQVPRAVLQLYVRQTRSNSWPASEERVQAIRFTLSERTEVYAIVSGYWERDQRFIYLQFDRKSEQARVLPLPLAGVNGVVKEGYFGHGGFDPGQSLLFLNISMARYSERTIWCWNQRIFVFRLKAVPGAGAFEGVQAEQKLKAEKLDCKGRPFKALRFAP